MCVRGGAHTPTRFLPCPSFDRIVVDGPWKGRWASNPIAMLRHQKLPCLFYDGRPFEQKKQDQGLRVCCCSRGDGLFGREREVAYLKQFVQRRKGHLMLLGGQQDCGKTAILREVANEEGKDRFLIVDLRTGLYNSPDGLLRALQDALAASYLSQPGGAFQQAWNNAWQGVTLRLKLQAPALKDFTAGLEAQNTFQQAHKDFQNVFTEVLKHRAAHGQAPPTLVIDEANKLQSWIPHPVYRATLLSYMDFFVLITKQEKLANVILVSSDLFFKFWLNENIRADRYRTHVIGDFPEAEAHAFFEFALGEKCPGDIWYSIYNVFGGSAFNLMRAAESLALLGEDGWKEDVVEMYSQIVVEVELGLSPKILNPRAVEACWTEEQYMQVLTKMTEYQNGVMPWNELRLLVGTEVVKALICYNMLQYRTKSTLARDLGWYKGLWPVVMPLSRLHWIAMMEVVMRDKGLLTVEEDDWQKLMMLASANTTLMLPGPDESDGKMITDVGS